MSLTIFDILKDIITTKSGNCINDSEFNTVFNSVIIVKYLGMDARFYLVASNAAKYVTVLSNESMYMYLVRTVPKYGNSYIKYLKKKKKDV